MASRKKTARKPVTDRTPDVAEPVEPADDQAALSFEAAMAELQQIVARMEDGDQALEATVRDFERGMELSRICQDNLKQAEARIDMLVRRAEDDYALEDFDNEDDAP